MTQEQAGLQRDLIGIVNGDRDGAIDAGTLSTALGYLRAEYVPFGKNDVVAIPSPDGATAVRAIVLDGGATNFTVRVLAEIDGNPKNRVLRDYSHILEMQWEEVAHGPITDFYASPSEEPVFVLSDVEGTRICWGDEWMVPLPAGAQWRVRMMDMGEWDDPVPLIEVLDGHALFHHSDGRESDYSMDASNVVPPWHADAPLAWKALRRDGAYFLEKHGESPRYACDAQMSRMFACGDELIVVDRIDPARPGRVQIRRVCAKDGPVEEPGVELANCLIRVLDLAATDRHYVITFDMDVTGESRSAGSRRRQVMVRDRDGGDRIEEEGDRIDARWHHADAVRPLAGTDGTRVVLVEVARRDERDRIVERGVAVYTDTGYALHALRGVAFDTLHLAGGQLWGWRPCPGGIILSRFPLP